MLRLEKFINVLGQVVAWLLLLMASITFVVVVLRYAFNVGAIALQELVVYMHALAFMFGLSFTLNQDEHVRVDLIYARLDDRRKAIVNLAGHLLLLIPTSLVIVIFSLDYVIASWEVLERSTEVRGLPGVFLLKTIIPVAGALLFIQSWIEIYRCISKLR